MIQQPLRPHPPRIVLGISGGIAAYKMPELIRLLRKAGVEVTVVLTQAAQPLVGIEALRTVSANPVYIDGPVHQHDMEHIRLADWADAMLICPATANTIAKLAHGIADNLLSTLALTFNRHLMVAPAMNTRMWEAAATCANVATLSSRGVEVFEVEAGELACGDSGAGRLLGLEKIVQRVCSSLTPSPLAGKRVLIASGPTAEPIDAVRVLTNRSSGRMGAALASVAARMGAEVTVVSGPAPIRPPADVTTVAVQSAREMLAALEERFSNCDICIMAAAVADFRPAQTFAGKLHRKESASLNLELVANPDIAKTLGGQKKGQMLVCFALEEQDGLATAREKLANKGADMVVLNYVGSSLELTHATAELLFSDGTTVQLPPMDKTGVAQAILEAIAARLDVHHG
jgi:phosphopantothenoylcysteine decarboxylase/phosphopantothenate--cysteine ligase